MDSPPFRPKARRGRDERTDGGGWSRLGRAKLDQRGASFLSRRAASPTVELPQSSSWERACYIPRESCSPALEALGLKGERALTDLFRAGRTVAGRGTSDRPPGICGILESASLSELGDHLVTRLSQQLSPPVRRTPDGDATRPAQPAGRALHHGARGRK